LIEVKVAPPIQQEILRFKGAKSFSLSYPYALSDETLIDL